MNEEEKKEEIIKEISEEEMDLIKQYHEEFSENIELVLTKDREGNYGFNLRYSDQSPGEIARFLAELQDVGIKTLITACLMQVKDRDVEIFNRVTKIYLNITEEANKQNVTRRIMQPTQVFNNNG